MKVLFTASECAPMVKVGGLGDVVGSLPKALYKQGVDVSVVLPLYATIDRKKYRLKPLFRGKRVKLSNKKTYPIGLWEGRLPGSKVPIYYVENKQFIGSGGVYFSASAIASHKKEIDRFNFFGEAVYGLMQAGLMETPDVLHAHDWHTGHLVGLLCGAHNDQAKRKRKPKNPACAAPAVFTIHNLLNRGIWKNHDPMKEGIVNATVVTTVSPTYAEEIRGKEFGYNLATVLKKRKPVGIVNGFDYGTLKNPPADKTAAKLAMQKRFGIKEGATKPLFGFVARLHEQKGVQWIIPIVACMVDLFDAEFVFLGTGVPEFEERLTELMKAHPENVHTTIGFDESLAQDIYAASDFFLMPSQFEPCGLGQMIAMYYGTIPIARKTGGLADTIRDNTTGFLFEKPNEHALFDTAHRALEAFIEEKKFITMSERAKKEDWSWERSAAKYRKLYRGL